MCRLDDQHFDAPNVTITTGSFGSISSLANFSDINDGMINYFVDRGYTVDVNLGAAPYDWRLAPGRFIVVPTLTLSNTKFPDSVPVE